MNDTTILNKNGAPKVHETKAESAEAFLHDLARAHGSIEASDDFLVVTLTGDDVEIVVNGSKKFAGVVYEAVGRYLHAMAKVEVTEYLEGLQANLIARQSVRAVISNVTEDGCGHKGCTASDADFPYVNDEHLG